MEKLLLNVAISGWQFLQHIFLVGVQKIFKVIISTQAQNPFSNRKNFSSISTVQNITENHLPDIYLEERVALGKCVAKTTQPAEP